VQVPSARVVRWMSRKAAVWHCLYHHYTGSSIPGAPSGHLQRPELLAADGRGRHSSRPRPTTTSPSNLRFRSLRFSSLHGRRRDIPPMCPGMQVGERWVISSTTRTRSQQFAAGSVHQLFELVLNMEYPRAGGVLGIDIMAADPAMDAGLAASAAFLARATELTPDPRTRTRRALSAAFASVQAGAFEATCTLITMSYREIARRRGTSRDAVKFHVASRTINPSRNQRRPAGARLQMSIPGSRPSNTARCGSPRARPSAGTCARCTPASGVN